MKKGILFDLDGTLINTWDLYIEAYKLTAQPYIRKPLKEQDIAFLKPSTEMEFINRLLSASETEKDSAYKRFITHYSNLHDRLFKGKYEGVDEMLDQLRGAGYRLGIITGKSRKAWNVTRRKSDLGTFDTVITDDDVDQSKPHAEGTFKALHDLRLDSSEVLFVGDTFTDYTTAKNAAVEYAAALWAKNKEELEEFKEKTAGDSNFFHLYEPDDLFDLL